MRIVHVSPFYYPSVGGVETFCRELATRTAKLGHEVHVVTYTQGNHREEFDEGVRVHRIEPIFKWYKARYSPLLRRLLKELRPDVVHIQAPAPLNENVAILNGSKRIATYHNDPMATAAPAYRLSRWVYSEFFFPRFCRTVDRVISPSKIFQETSLFLRRLPAEKKGVIPNGVDVEVFSPGNMPKQHYRERLGLKSERIGIFVGSMEKWHSYKGIPVLLEALARLAKYNLDFLLVGDGDLRNNYERMARNLAPNARISFIGYVDEPALIDCLRSADFLVLPSISRMEGFGIVLIEAMACGLPVITTDIPGPSGLVEQGLNGLLTKPGDPTALAEAMKQMILLDEASLGRVSAEARRIAESNYSWEKVVRAYEEEYKCLLSIRR